jgi:hypothetical protein
MKAICSAEGYLTSCTFDYLTQTVSNKLFVISIFSFAYLIPMSLIIYFYSRIVGLVVNHEKALKEQVRTFIIINLCISYFVCVSRGMSCDVSARCRINNQLTRVQLIWFIYHDFLL